MLGFSKKEIMALLEKVKMTDSQKNAIADIIYHNNQRIEQEIGYILDLILDEQKHELINVFFH